MARHSSDGLKTAAVNQAGSTPVGKIELYPILGNVAANKGLRRRIIGEHTGQSSVIWSDYCTLLAFNYGKSPPLGIVPEMLNDGEGYGIHYTGYFNCQRPEGYTGSIKYTFGYVAAGLVVFKVGDVEGMGASPHAILECGSTMTSADWLKMEVYYLRATSSQTKCLKEERFVAFWKDNIDNEWRVIGADVTCPPVGSFSNLNGTPIFDIVEMDLRPGSLGRLGIGGYTDPADYWGVPARYLLTVHKVGDNYHFHRDDDDTEIALTPGQTIMHALHPGVAGGDFVTITWSDTINNGDMAEVYTAKGSETALTLPNIQYIDIEHTIEAASVLRFGVPVTDQPFDPDNVTKDNAYTYYMALDTFGVLRKNSLVKAYLGYQVAGEPEYVRRFTGFIQDIQPRHRKTGEAVEKLLEVTCFDARVKATNPPVSKIEDMYLGPLPNDLSYDIIGCFPESDALAGPDGQVRPPAFDKWKLTDVIRTVLYQCGFQSSQLWSKNEHGEFLIDDRDVRLEATPAYPHSVVSVMGVRSEVKQPAWSKEGQLVAGARETRPDGWASGSGYVFDRTHYAPRWHDYAETRRADYLHQFTLDSEPWMSLQDLCQSYGLDLGVNADGNVYMRYPNNPRIFNTESHDVDSGTGATYTQNTLTDVKKSWDPDVYKNGIVYISQGKGIGQKKKVHINSSSKLWVTDWDIIPDGGSLYIVAKHEKMLENYIVYDSAWEQIPPEVTEQAGGGEDEK